MAAFLHHSVGVDLWKKYATCVWFSRRLVDGDQWYDISELYQLINTQTGLVIHKRDRQLIFDRVFSSFRHLLNGHRKHMPNGMQRSLKIGFRFAIDQDIARMDDLHNPFEKPLQLTDVEQERLVTYMEQIKVIREKWNNDNTTKRIYWQLHDKKSDEELVDLLLRRDRRCGWYLRPDPNGFMYALEEQEPQTKERNMWSQILYKKVIYTRNKSHWKALMGIDVTEHARQSFMNFGNNLNDLYKELDPDEKAKLLEDLRGWVRSSDVFDRESLSFISQVFHQQ